MKIQYCSDLHLEFYENHKFILDNPLEVKGDILILAGDITLLSIMNDFRFFIDYVSENFKYTYWIPGNHEYYNYDISKLPKSFKNKLRDNVFFVNNITETHNGVKFIFSTLWSNISPENAFTIQRSLNDFRLIKNNKYPFTIDDYNELHNNDLGFIKNEIHNSTHKKTVVVTHHVPTYMKYPEQYKGSPINEAFVTELYDFIEQSTINHWIYGHSHGNTPDFKIGKTTLHTNQLGYIKARENEKFVSGKYFEI